MASARPLVNRLRRTARRSRGLTRWWILRRLARDPRPPFVVFTMGKVASTTVYRSLTPVAAPVLKVHSVRSERLAVMEESYRRTDPKALPRHLLHGWHLMDRPPTPDAPWTVITLVRDPIQRSVSDFFHSGSRMGRLDTEATAGRLARFVEREGIPRTLDWFERELEPVLGIDVLSHPFDPAIGHATVETPAARLLVLRQESLDVAPAALGRFLGLDHDVVLDAYNVGAAKPYAAAYADATEQLRFDDHVLDLAYESTWAKHFYSPAERQALRARWGRSASEPVA